MFFAQQTACIQSDDCVLIFKKSIVRFARLCLYGRFASLEPVPGAPVEDSDVYPMVVNIGKRPTFDDHNELTIEAHIMHKYQNNFYGSKLKLLLLGFIRPELKFSGLQKLVNRIKADVGLAKSQLQTPELIAHKMDPFFSWKSLL